MLEQPAGGTIYIGNIPVVVSEPQPGDVLEYTASTGGFTNRPSQGEVLGGSIYAPAVAVPYALVVATTGLTALDTVNLKATFEVPENGIVIPKCQAFIKGGAAAATSVILGVTSTDATHSPGTIVGVTALVALTPTATAADNGQLVALEFPPVSGLTPGEELTWYLAGAYSGTQPSVIAQGGALVTTVPTGAPAVFKVSAG